MKTGNWSTHVRNHGSKSAPQQHSTLGWFSKLYPSIWQISTECSLWGGRNSEQQGQVWNKQRQTGPSNLQQKGCFGLHLRTSEAKVIFFVPQTSPALCSLSVLVSCLLAWHKLEPSVQRKSQLRNRLRKIRLAVDLWKGFSSNDWCGRCHPGQVVLGGKESKLSKLGCKPGSSPCLEFLPRLPLMMELDLEV